MVAGGGKLSNATLTPPFGLQKSLITALVGLKNHCCPVVKRTFVISMTFYGSSNANHAQNGPVRLSARFISKLRIHPPVTRSNSSMFCFSPISSPPRPDQRFQFEPRPLMFSAPRRTLRQSLASLFNFFVLMSFTIDILMTSHA